MISILAHELRAKLTQAYMQVQDSTGSGQASDWADYRYRIGVLTGLKRALQEVDETYHKLMHEVEG